MLTGAEAMRDLNETLRALTYGLSWGSLVTGPEVALDVTLGRRQECATARPRNYRPWP